MALAMLHLSVTPGAAACVDHGAMVSHHVATSLPSGLQHAPAHTHAGGALAEQSPVPPCDVPVQPSCCSVIAGCATIGLASHLSTATPALPDAAPVHETQADVPMSRRAAPEPPPPKR
jgi:hypothetical protein